MLFTPRLLLLNEEKTTVVRKSALGQTIYVVPRADCSFRRVRLAGLGREAKAAAQLKARSEALPGENGARLVMDSALKTAGESAALPSPSSAPAFMAGIWSFPLSAKHKGRYLPETLAQMPMDTTSQDGIGARIIRGVSGYEGQIWRQSDLVASRWWGRLPTDIDWDGFLRAAQETLGPLDMARPAAQDAVWRTDLPVFDISPERLSEVFSPVNVGGAVTALLLCGGLYISGQYLRESLALRDVENKAVSIRGETEQIQSERRRALTNMGFVRKYRKLGDNGIVLGGLGAVANVLGETALGIEQMNLRSGALELRLKGEDEISVPDMVAALEAEAVLSNVSISLETAGAIIIKADVSAPALQKDAQAPGAAPAPEPASEPASEPAKVPASEPAPKPAPKTTKEGGAP